MTLAGVGDTGFCRGRWFSSDGFSTQERTGNVLELEQKLNDAGLVPQVSGGEVTLHRVDGDYNFGPALTEAELLEFGLTSESLLLDEHPEGADRGGYVPFAGDVHYREDLGEWV